MHQPNEFEGAMRIPDTERVLKTKRKKNLLVELVISRFLGMMAFRPIIGNFIAISMAFVALYYLFEVAAYPWLEGYRQYLAILIECAAGLQIIKSSTRSLLLPFVALVIGGTLSTVDLNLGWGFNPHFFEALTLVGVLGCLFAVINID